MLSYIVELLPKIGTQSILLRNRGEMERYTINTTINHGGRVRRVGTNAGAVMGMRMNGDREENNNSKTLRQE